MKGWSRMKSTSIVLGEDQDVFIKSQIKKGRFGSVSETLRAGLRLLEEQELKVEALRAAIIAGEESGPSQTFNMDKFLAAKRKAK
jgi:antitoxin ParD1/3/4